MAKIAKFVGLSLRKGLIFYITSKIYERYFDKVFYVLALFFRLLIIILFISSILIIVGRLSCRIYLDIKQIEPISLSNLLKQIKIFSTVSITLFFSSSQFHTN